MAEGCSFHSAISLVVLPAASPSNGVNGGWLGSRPPPTMLAWDAPAGVLCAGRVQPVMTRYALGAVAYLIIFARAARFSALLVRMPFSAAKL